MPRLLRLILAFVGAGASAYFSYNAFCLWLDPFNVVWDRPYEREIYVFDQTRYHKTKLLLRSPNSYEIFILSNSRGFDNRAPKLSRMLGRQTFNYSTTSDYPLGYLLKMRWLARTQTNLKDVVLVLWYDQFQMAGTNDAILMVREHYAITGESRFSYYWAFSELPFKTVADVVLHYLRSFLHLEQPRDDRKFVDPETNEFVLARARQSDDEAYRNYQSRIEMSSPGTIQFRESSLTPAEQKIRAHSFDELPLQDIQISNFVELMDFLRRSRIRYHCVVPPINAHVMSWVPRAKYVNWMKLLVTHCGEVWDFSLPSEVTKNDFNYLDWSHFEGDIGYLMLAKVLGGEIQDLEQHSDFGRLLRQADSDRYAEMLEAAMRQ
jgi:hypothetical protein